MHVVNNKSVSVHVATNDDASAVFALAQTLATTFQLSQERFFESFSRLLLNRDALLLIGESEGGLTAGYLLGFVHDTFYANGPAAWIEEVIVNSKFRRTGVATAMNRGFELWARDRGAGLMALATRRASSFYEAMGYEESAAYFRKLI